MSAQPQRLYEFGPYRLDTAERLLLREGEPVPLTPKVFETLVVLVERSGHLVEKDDLMKTVWADAFVEESNLTNNVYALRKILGKGENGRSYIETVPKRGYRFAAPVRELPADTLLIEKRTLTRIVTEETEQDIQSVAALPQPETIVRAANPLPTTSRRWSWAVFVAGIILVGAMAAFGVYWLIAQSKARTRTKAVAPFSMIDMSRLTSSGKSKHAAISPDGKYIAHVTDDAEGDSLWVRQVGAPNDVRISGPTESEFLWVAFAPDGNSIYYVALDRDKGDTGLYRVPVLGGPSSMAGYDVWPVGFSPDGKEMAFIRMNRGESYLIIANADSTNQRILAKRQNPDFFRGEWNAPAWSPDGKSIACPVRLTDEKGEFETILGVDVKDGSQTLLTSKRWSSVGQPGWLADGTGVMLTAREQSTSPRQVWHIAVKKGGEVTRVTHDLNDYDNLSLTQNSSKLTVVQDQTVSKLSVAREGDAADVRQIVSEMGSIDLLKWTHDGRIVYRSNAGESSEIWITNPDGAMRRQLTAGARVSGGLAVSPDDRYVFFVSDRAGHFNIWRVDADGQNLKQITTGEGEFFPECSPDGEWIVYQQGYYEPRVWKMRTDGGSAMQLTVTRASRPAVSPDGQMVAYHYLDPELEKSRWSIGVVSVGGGTRLLRFDLPATVGVTGRFVRWFPDQKAIAYVNRPAEGSDIWLQQLDGSLPRQLTNFKAEQIIAFDWSRDGRSLAFVRGTETSDVVLIEQRQKRD